jgi:hypothetical protein
MLKNDGADPEIQKMAHNLKRHVCDMHALPKAPRPTAG